MKAIGDVQMTGKNNMTADTYSATDATGRFALALSTANSDAAFDSISTKNGELVSIKLQDVGSAVDRIWIMLLFETVLSISQQSADSLQ